MVGGNANKCRKNEMKKKSKKYKMKASTKSAERWEAGKLELRKA